MARTEIERAEFVERLRGMFPDEDTTGFNPFDLLYRFGSPLTALLYSELFWPQFVEFSGMVFLESDVEDDADRERIMVALARHAGDTQHVEKIFNYVEVPSLFGRRAEESTNQEDRLLAERMAVMWRARLAELYPDKSFEIQIVEPPHGSDDELGFCFYQLGKRCSEERGKGATRLSD